MCSESALFSFQLLYVLHFFKYKVWKSFIFEDSVNYEKGFRVCSIVTGFACIRNAKKLTLSSVSNHVKHFLFKGEGVALSFIFLSGRFACAGEESETMKTGQKIFCNEIFL